MNKYIHTTILFVLSFCTIQAQSIDLSSISNFHVINRSITISTSGNKKTIRLNAVPDVGIAWLNNIKFTSGTIEFDIKGKDVLQQSFVGIAFHGINDSSYDCIYFRPFNFNAADTTRQNHAVQYISLPQYDWLYFRENFTGLYEHAIVHKTDPDNWFHAKVIVKDNEIIVYMDNSDTACLTVKKLNNYPTGKIGFWVGNNSDGDFSNLIIKKN